MLYLHHLKDEDIKKKKQKKWQKYEGQRLEIWPKRKISEESLIRNEKERFISNMATTLDLRLSSLFSNKNMSAILVYSYSSCQILSNLR